MPRENIFHITLALIIRHHNAKFGYRSLSDSEHIHKKCMTTRPICHRKCMTTRPIRHRKCMTTRPMHHRKCMTTCPIRHRQCMTTRSIRPLEGEFTKSRSGSGSLETI